MESLTIVIPTHNRPVLLARQIRFLAACDCPYPILIADSSAEENAARNKKSCENFSNYIDISYTHWSSSEFSALEKWLETIKKCETPFSVLCADDDLPNLVTYASCVHFLEQNPSFSSCAGEFLSYYRNAQNELVFGFDFSCESIENPDPLSRWVQLIGAYSAMMYAIQPTHFLQSSFECIYASLGKNPECPNFIELLHSSLTVLEGKFKRVEGFQSLRKGWPPTLGWENDVTLPDFSNSYRNFKSKIIGKLPESQTIESIVDATFTNYLRSSIARLPIPNPNDRCELEQFYAKALSQKNRSKNLDSIVGASGKFTELILTTASAVPDEPAS